MSDFIKDYEREYYSKQERAEARQLRKEQRSKAAWHRSVFPKKSGKRSRKDQPSGCAVVGFLLIGGLALLSI